MLKIKDNVDLKELEKYGFKLKYNENDGKPFYYVKRFVDANRKGEITIYVKDREISCYVGDETEKVNDTLYDLIKTDLVEKVDDE